MARRAKRWLDVCVASLALLVLSPLLAVAALLVRWRLGPPVLFRQVRPGCKAVPFTIFKLRTMNDARDSKGEPLPDAQRLTKLGAFLRAISVDEIPQLWNVLRGDMSLVGPRPLLLKYLERYSPEQSRRHEVQPGITGWAQVNGRNATTWEERFKLDVWYVDHWSFWLDIRIVLRTLRMAVLRHGIAQEGHVTMPEFQGSGRSS